MDMRARVKNESGERSAERKEVGGKEWGECEGAACGGVRGSRDGGRHVRLAGGGVGRDSCKVFPRKEKRREKWEEWGGRVIEL